ncbi:MAG: RNA-guided endonuclease TnpB family protein [Rivularia sp. (in: cyanobacteria)]
MARSTTPSFVTELPLKVSSQQKKELLAIFQVGRQLYNACLNEALERMELVRNSEPYQQAKKLNRTRDKKQRRELFREARKLYRFSDYDLQSFATLTAKKSVWIASKIDSHTQQKLGSRAFKAVEKVMFGKAKKVRFKVPSRFKSLESKTNASGIRFKNNQFIWSKLTLEPIMDWTNPVIVHGLNSRVKYCRVVWRFIGNKRRWYVQLINEGLPYQKPNNYVKDGLVGLDLNINNVAFVADNKAGLLPFAENVPNYDKEVKKLQRKMARSSRINNPDNYEPDTYKKVGNTIRKKKGQIKKSTKKNKLEWNNSKTYRKIRRRKADLERRRSAYAKSQNRRLVNEILRHGNIIKTENVSIKGWQKRYGKGISLKCPGFFQSELTRKAVSAGGQFLAFSTHKTALSQVHSSGIRIKKKLSERVHYDVNGFKMHRDLWSAYLSRHVYDDSLSVVDALLDYPGVEPSLQDAWKAYESKSASRVSSSESRSYHNSSERISSVEVLNPAPDSLEGRKARVDA